jgi:CRISPR-associated protein Cmr2
MQLYWQSKIWALLHDPIFKPFGNNKSGESYWRTLAVMKDWQNFSDNDKLLKYLKNADFISAASDRAAIGNLDGYVNYDKNSGLEISHLLSGKKQNIKVPDRQALISKEQALFPPSIVQETDPQKVFWWLWRCLPTEACKVSKDTSLLLMPADTRIPDTSLWSHTSMTAALAGASIGYQTTMAEFDAIPDETLSYKYHSQPYLVSFSFAPVQDLIKSSRKMRDFWAGSWILHYLSAKISWVLAQKYGADSLLYPSLFHQPLIDLWLLEKYPDFKDWIKTPPTDALLTAGFPNVLVLVLPKDEVSKAMQLAQQVLKETWRDLGNEVFDRVGWSDKMSPDANSWGGWLEAQWQHYWTGLSIGKVGTSFKQGYTGEQNERYFEQWVSTTNQTYGLKNISTPLKLKKDKEKSERELFQPAEINFLKSITSNKYPANIGSWWGYIFDAMRLNLTAVKNARNWQLPTVFSTRSTISGIGAAVHSNPKDWAKEGEVKRFWQHPNYLFNGSEQLNATEVVKRGLHHILPELLGRGDLALAKPPLCGIAYPDLTAGVAGYLKTNSGEVSDYYQRAWKEISTEHKLNNDRSDDYKWGIPWAEKQEHLKEHHPRLLNAGWLVEDLGIDPKNTQELQERRNQLNTTIDRFYPYNNPTDWYVLAAGDGDGMSDWLKGEKLAPYSEYVASTLPQAGELTEFLKIGKRMGPSTHNALSRALLDFSNQLVPYLTEERYAGRLIYAGGDDVLAYTNLWEWDSWLWDVSECFRGRKDPHDEFKNDGDYWQWAKSKKPPERITPRPLFTMGGKATISFGIVIAHQSVPLAIALENLWAAKASAKEHMSQNPDRKKAAKDAVQVRVMYQNGNILSSTSKFEVFNSWRELIDGSKKLGIIDASLFEQAATVWAQHPAPNLDALDPWCRAFCLRREVFGDDEDKRSIFSAYLSNFIKKLSKYTLPNQLVGGASPLENREITNWLKLAAFTVRRREIKLGAK